MDFRNFFIPCVIEVKISIFCCFLKLTSSSELQNPGQLPVSEVLEGAVDWVLWISVIFSFLTFSMSGKLFLAVCLSYVPCPADLEYPGQLPGQDR